MPLPKNPPSPLKYLTGRNLLNCESCSAIEECTGQGHDRSRQTLRVPDCKYRYVRIFRLEDIKECRHLRRR